MQEGEIIDGNYIFVINGIPRDWSPNSQAVAVGCWMFALSLTGFVPPLEFIFRYFAVVRYVTFVFGTFTYSNLRGILLDGRWLCALAAVVVALSFANFSLLLACFHAVRDQHALFDHFMRDPMWSPDGKLPAFVGASEVHFQTLTSAM